MERVNVEPVSSPRKIFTRRVLITIGIVAVTTLFLLALGYFAYLVLLVFAGILLAVFLRGLAAWLSAHMPISTGGSLAFVILFLLSLLGLGAWLLGPAIASHFDELARLIPQALNQFREFIQEHNMAGRLFQQTKSTFFTQETFAQIAGIFSNLLGLITGLLIIFINGLYFSVEPEVYIKGTVALLPKSKRARARVVFSELGHALRWWLVGRIASMTILGVLTWIGLLLLGIPSAAALAFLAALLSFIPNIGPLVSAVPAVLVGWMQGPMSALYVVLLYIALQTVESYLITPLIQRQTVMLPPALILTVQLAMGMAFGILGILLATPLAVVLLVLVQRLYVETILEGQTDLP